MFVLFGDRVLHSWHLTHYIAEDDSELLIFLPLGLSSGKNSSSDQLCLLSRVHLTWACRLLVVPQKRRDGDGH